MNSTYNQTHKPKFDQKEYYDAKVKNKALKQFGDGTNHVLGHDKKKIGEGRPDAKALNRAILDFMSKNGSEREEYKERGERQNFTIQPQKKLENSPAGRIGDKALSPVKNTIDIDDLKRSHVPFGTIRDDISNSVIKPKADLMPKFNFSSTTSQAWNK